MRRGAMAAGSPSPTPRRRLPPPVDSASARRRRLAAVCLTYRSSCRRRPSPLASRSLCFCSRPHRGPQLRAPAASRAPRHHRHRAGRRPAGAAAGRWPEASLETARDLERRSIATVAQVRTSLEQRQQGRQRAEQLFAGGGIARAEVERLRLAVQAGEREVEGAEAGARAAAHDLESARAALMAAGTVADAPGLRLTCSIGGRVFAIPERSAFATALACRPVRSRPAADRRNTPGPTCGRLWTRARQGCSIIACPNLSSSPAARTTLRSCPLSRIATAASPARPGPASPSVFR